MTIPQGATYDIRVYQGATFAEDFDLKEADGETPIPLTGYVAVAEMRRRPGSADVLATFDTDVDEAGGSVSLVLTPEQTTALTGRRAAYDVFLVGASDTVLFLQGSVVIDPRVTEVE